MKLNLSNSQRSRQAETQQRIKDIENHDGPVIIVDKGRLTPLQTRPSLKDYVLQLWERRHFIWADARSKALRTTRDYRLWKLWLVINPLLNVVFYGFLFGVLFKTSRGVPNFVGYLFIGTTFMPMMSGLLSQGTSLLPSNRAMIRAFNFPTASLAFSQTLRSAIDNLIPAAVSIVVALLLQWHTVPSWKVIFVVPLFLMIHIFGCGLLMIGARVCAQLPDVKAVVPLVTQAWFFLSGVMFTLDRFDHVPTVKQIMSHNPAYEFLSAVRNVAIYDTIPSLSEWGSLCAWTFGLFAVGFLFFWQAEDRYVRLT